jgi:ribonuclease HI
VDLYHIFWGCPAVKRLREVMLRRWQSAGLRTGGRETAFFSLALPEVPVAIARITGEILVDSIGDSAGTSGDVVETMLAQCWTIGAALYFHSAWRWRLAYFDPHNDTTRKRQEAAYAARLRTGHATAVRECLTGRPDTETTRVGRVICERLGGYWTGTTHVSVTAGSAVIIFVAGRTTRVKEQGYSGVLIARVHAVTEVQQKVLYLGGSRYPGKMARAQQAIHLGLLAALRQCRRREWGPVHVAGDNKVVLRQHATRTLPRGAASKAPFWKAKRTADAAGVASWLEVPRERNRTAHEVMGTVMASHQDVAWEPSGGRNAGMQ